MVIYRRETLPRTLLASQLNISAINGSFDKIIRELRAALLSSSYCCLILLVLFLSTLVSHIKYVCSLTCSIVRLFVTPLIVISSEKQPVLVRPKRERERMILLLALFFLCGLVEAGKTRMCANHWCTGIAMNPHNIGTAMKPHLLNVFLGVLICYTPNFILKHSTFQSRFTKLMPSTTGRTQNQASCNSLKEQILSCLEWKDLGSMLRQILSRL